MNAPPEIPTEASRRRWALPAVLAVGAVLVLFGLLWPTFFSMVEIWERSETFTHGYLIIPISLWLIWRQRARLAAITPRPAIGGLVLLAAAGAGWLLADAGGVQVVAQYAFIAMLIGVVWAILGNAFVRAALFPLLFLFFAVPVGEFLIQPLMGVTADFTVAMLQATGIPVYREGMFFSIPSGDWSVVEGCSGLRYLIASVTLGVLYAYLTYRSWQRRLLFSIAAVIVPIFANSGRAFMIVMIGHLSDMKLAVGVDHLIYGWVFFGVVMLALFWIGGFWREDDEAVVAPAAPPPAATEDAPPRRFVGMVIASLLIAGLWPGYAAWLDARPLPPLPELVVSAPDGAGASGWRAVAPLTDWVPHWVGADRQYRQTYAQSGRRVMLQLDYYVTQRQDAELINSQNYMIKQKDLAWSNVGEMVTEVEIGGERREVRQAKLRGSSGENLLVWQWNRIDERVVVNDYLAKLILARDRVRLARDDGLSVLIATPYETGNVGAAQAVLARFAAEMAPAVQQALKQVQGP